MTRLINKACLGICSLLFISACSSETDEMPIETSVGTTAEQSVQEISESVIDDCASEAGLTYLCGVLNAEDLLSLGDTGMILASGMSSDGVTGHIYLIDPEVDSVEDLIFDGSFTQDFDSEAYSQCPGPLSLDDFSAHGLALNEYEPGYFQVYVTSHGEREAIEIFEIDMVGASSVFRWKGCVALPEDALFNSVAILDDGGFVTTKFLDNATGFAVLANGEINGGVYEWHPGGEVLFVAGSELSGANGIALSDDQRYMYVAAFGGRELVKFDRSVTPVTKETVALDITLDNIRWGINGKLLTAGNNYVSPEDCTGAECATGWSVVEVDPDSLEVARIGGADQSVAMQGVSTALEVDGTIWVGTYSGDRIAYFSKE